MGATAGPTPQLPGMINCTKVASHQPETTDLHDTILPPISGAGPNMRADGSRSLQHRHSRRSSSNKAPLAAPKRPASSGGESAGDDDDYFVSCSSSGDETGGATEAGGFSDDAGEATSPKHQLIGGASAEASAAGWQWAATGCPPLGPGEYCLPQVWDAATAAAAKHHRAYDAHRRRRHHQLERFVSADLVGPLTPQNSAGLAQWKRVSTAVPMSLSEAASLAPLVNKPTGSAQRPCPPSARPGSSSGSSSSEGSPTGADTPDARSVSPSRRGMPSSLSSGSCSDSCGSRPPSRNNTDPPPPSLGQQTHQRADALPPSLMTRESSPSGGQDLSMGTSRIGWELRDARAALAKRDAEVAALRRRMAALEAGRELDLEELRIQVQAKAVLQSELESVRSAALSPTHASRGSAHPSSPSSSSSSSSSSSPAMERCSTSSLPEATPEEEGGSCGGRLWRGTAVEEEDGRMSSAMAVAELEYEAGLLEAALAEAREQHAAEVSDLRRALAERDAELDALHAAAEELCCRADERERVLDTVLQQVAAMEDARGVELAQLAEAADANKRLRVELQTVRCAFGTAGHRDGGLASEMVCMQWDAAEVRAELRDTRREAGAVQGASARLQRRVTELEVQLRLRGEELQAAHASADAAQRQALQHKQRLAEYGLDDEEEGHNGAIIGRASGGGSYCLTGQQQAAARQEAARLRETLKALEGEVSGMRLLLGGARRLLMQAEEDKARAVSEAVEAVMQQQVEDSAAATTRETMALEGRQGRGVAQQGVTQQQQQGKGRCSGCATNATRLARTQAQLAEMGAELDAALAGVGQLKGAAGAAAARGRAIESAASEVAQLASNARSATKRVTELEAQLSAKKAEAKRLAAERGELEGANNLLRLAARQAEARSSKLESDHRSRKAATGSVTSLFAQVIEQEQTIKDLEEQLQVLQAGRTAASPLPASRRQVTAAASPSTSRKHQRQPAGLPGGAPVSLVQELQAKRKALAVLTQRLSAAQAEAESARDAAEAQRATAQAERARADAERARLAELTQQRVQDRADAEKRAQALEARAAGAEARAEEAGKRAEAAEAFGREAGGRIRVALEHAARLSRRVDLGVVRQRELSEKLREQGGGCKPGTEANEGQVTTTAALAPPGDHDDKEEEEGRTQDSIPDFLVGRTTWTQGPAGADVHLPQDGILPEPLSLRLSMPPPSTCSIRPGRPIAGSSCSCSSLPAISEGPSPSLSPASVDCQQQQEQHDIAGANGGAHRGKPLGAIRKGSLKGLISLFSGHACGAGDRGDGCVAGDDPCEQPSTREAAAGI